MVRTNQGGSVLIFIIAGVVLTALLIGGIFWIHQQNTTAPAPLPTPTTPTAPTEPQASKPEESHDSHQTANNTPVQPQATNTGPTSSSELPATGPTESVASILVAAIISGTAVSFVRSRREIASL
jgi:LPXTG-motif cell wall-anchored protein